MIHVAVVGCGRIAEKHLNGYRSVRGVDVTVTDVSPRGRRIAERYGVGWHDDPLELIARTDVDAVDICTPTPSHASLILDALAHGKHVFCEKPLARSVEEAEEIRRAAEAAGRLVMVGYLYRFHPALRLGREVVEEEIIGRPYYASFRVGARGGHKAWEHRRETGGGVGNEVLVHMLDLAMWYFGDVLLVDNLHTATVLPEREIEGETVEADAEDVMMLKLEMENGVQAFCQADLLTPGYTNVVEVQGTNGSLFASIVDHVPTTVYCKEPRGVYDRGHNVFTFPKTDLFSGQLSHFVACVRGDDTNGVHSVADSSRLMSIVEAALAERDAVSRR